MQTNLVARNADRASEEGKRIKPCSVYSIPTLLYRVLISVVCCDGVGQVLPANPRGL